MDETIKNQLSFEEQVRIFTAENHQLKLDNDRLIDEKKFLSNQVRKLSKLVDQLEDKTSFIDSASEIAHEINNPINFISGSVSIIKRGVNDFIELISMYQQLDGFTHHPLYKKIQNIEKEIDMELTKRELKDATITIEKGLERIHEISYNLSLVGKENLALVIKLDINQSLNDTLMMVEDKINGQIKIHKDFGNIPEINSYRGKLNQVFTNIITNAIDAIQAKPTVQEHQLFVKTLFNGRNVIVKIKDTGCGMNEETKKRLFEKFYTTKTPGKGNGLGMAVCKTIIEKHNGNIEVESEQGIGTEFTIFLPIIT